MVNCLSHSFKFSFRPYDLTKLPVSYSGIIIDSSNDGKTLSMKLEVLISLFDEIIGFLVSDRSRVKIVETVIMERL